ncbi:hypothetical protein ACFLS9_02455 [Bacteroidota bacterium]
MRKFLIAGIILFSQLVSTAQTNSEISWVYKFGVAGGITPMWLFPDFQELNKVLPDFGVKELPSSGIFGLGGAGYAYIMIVDNLRIGGAGFSGTVSRDNISGGFRKEIEYSIGGGGLTIEYTLPMIKRIAISVGTMIGGGEVDIKIYQNNGDFSWNGIWDEVTDPSINTENINRRISKSFFTITPTINVDIPINRFMAVRVGGGYLVELSGDWKVDNGVKLSGVPSNLNGNSFFIQTGLLVGLFAY